MRKLSQWIPEFPQKYPKLWNAQLHSCWLSWFLVPLPLLFDVSSKLILAPPKHCKETWDVTPWKIQIPKNKSKTKSQETYEREKNGWAIYTVSHPNPAHPANRQQKNVLKNFTIGPSISQSKPNNHLKNWQAFKKEKTRKTEKNKTFRP